MKNEINDFLKREGAILCAHHYVSNDLQSIALSSGGMVGDSLEIAKFTSAISSKKIIIAGVRFMGETAKVLSPSKSIYMIDESASCSLVDDLDFDKFLEFKSKNDGKELVVYANSSVDVKAKADWVVTSSNAEEIIEHIYDNNKEVAFAADTNLAKHLIRQTGITFDYFEGSCFVHEEFNSEKLKKMMMLNLDAKVLSHPESNLEIVKMSDFTGSTGGILKYVKNSKSKKFIIVTEKNLIARLEREFPEREFLLCPTGTQEAVCRSCARCPFMAQNSSDLIKKYTENEVILSDDIISAANKSIQRMISFESY